MDIKLPTLETGSKGWEVAQAQVLLNLKHREQIPVDGNYGAKTAAAVEEWQKANALKLVDGIVGAETWESLLTDPPKAPDEGYS